MRTIDAEHIDEWLFDHFEGNLNVAEQQTLTAFLHANPLLKVDYDAWKNSYISEPEIVYPKAGQLLKPAFSSTTKIPSISIGILAIAAVVLLFMKQAGKETLPVEKTIPGILHADSIAEPNKDKLLPPIKTSPVIERKNGSAKDPAVDSLIIPPLMIPKESPSLQADSVTEPTLLPVRTWELPKDSSKVKTDTTTKKKKKPLKMVKLNNTGF